MQYRENGTKYQNYYLWENRKYAPYDYMRGGLLQHILSNKIVTTENPILKFVLQYYEKSIFFMLKYVDKLKHFKNYHLNNR